MLSSWSRDYCSSKVGWLATSWCNSMSSVSWSMRQWICIEKSNMPTEWRSPAVKCFPQRWFSMRFGTPHSSIHVKSFTKYIPDLYRCCHTLYLKLYIRKTNDKLEIVKRHSFVMMMMMVLMFAVLCDCNYTISCVTMYSINYSKQCLKTKLMLYIR